MPPNTYYVYLLAWHFKISIILHHIMLYISTWNKVSSEKKVGMRFHLQIPSIKAARTKYNYVALPFQDGLWGTMSWNFFSIRFSWEINALNNIGMLVIYLSGFFNSLRHLFSPLTSHGVFFLYFLHFLLTWRLLFSPAFFGFFFFFSVVPVPSFQLLESLLAEPCPTGALLSFSVCSSFLC